MLRVKGRGRGRRGGRRRRSRGRRRVLSSSLSSSYLPQHQSSFNTHCWDRSNYINNDNDNNYN